MAGEDRWSGLEPRSSASRVQGDCQLVLVDHHTGGAKGPPPAALHPMPIGSRRAADQPALRSRGTRT